MAKLILISGDDRKEFELGPFNSIGRHPDNTIQILDRIISKEHCQIAGTAEGRFILRDLGSLNGTYVGADRVNEQMLKDGDEISMGSTKLLYVEDRPDQAALRKVTIAPGTMESHIRQRIAAEGRREFLPEKSIADVGQLRRDYERLRIGHELAKAVGAELDLDSLLAKILDKAFEILGADRGAILLMDGRGDLVPRYFKQRQGTQEQLVLSNTVLAEVVTSKTAVLSSDATMDSRFSGAQSVIMQGIRSTMTVPLIVADEILGIMHLDSQLATGAFTEKDLEVFTGIAAQAAISIQNARLARKIEQEAQTRAQFARLIPPHLVDQVVRGELAIERGGKLQEITMLYSDIRGFTAMSERTSPQEIVSLLNEYFEVMVDIIFKWNGTLDKFVGDEIIALFGVLPIADAPAKAVNCALEMQRALTELNLVWAESGRGPFKIGVGINTGTVVTGAIGSSKALQYTAIGDPMNIASRLCSNAKADEIIVSDTTYRQVGDLFIARELPPLELKGKSLAMQTFCVTGTTKPNWSLAPTKH